MYIRLEDDRCLLIRTLRGPEGQPRELVLADLGQDPELNLFFTAESGRLRDPDLWEGVTDFHLLQALENYKRRLGGFRPVLVAVKGNRAAPDAEET